MDVEHEEIAGDGSVGSLEALVRRITEKPSKYDKDIDDGATAFPFAVCKEAPKPDSLDMPAFKPMSREHCLTHRPKHKDCEACAFAKTVKKPSRSRPNPGVTCKAADMKEMPFGGCVHCDHIVVRSGTNAARAAKVALLFYDEATQYGQAFPSQSRETDVVVSCFHHFEGPDQRIRRLWSDNAGELVSAGARIRAQRPLAHYVSIPGRPQSNGIIER